MAARAQPTVFNVATTDARLLQDELVRAPQIEMIAAVDACDRSLTIGDRRAVPVIDDLVTDLVATGTDRRTDPHTDIPRVTTKLLNHHKDCLCGDQSSRAAPAGMYDAGYVPAGVIQEQRHTVGDEDANRDGWIIGHESINAREGVEPWWLAASSVTSGYDAYLRAVHLLSERQRFRRKPNLEGERAPILGHFAGVIVRRVADVAFSGQ